MMDTIQELEGEGSFPRFKYPPFLIFLNFFPLLGSCINVFGHLHYVRVAKLIRLYIHIRTYIL